MATNLLNFGIFEGRVVSQPFYFQANGGEVVSLKLAARRNWTPKGQDGPDSDFIEFRDYIPVNNSRSGGHGVYDYLEAGDLVKVEFTLRSSVSTKDGEKNYYQTCQIEQLQISESKAVRDARRKEKATAAVPKKK